MIKNKPFANLSNNPNTSQRTFAAVKIDMVLCNISRGLEFHCTVVLLYDGRKLNGFDLEAGLCF